MALPANTHWRVRAGGDALNGGGFCPGGSGTDYSDSDTPILSLTDLATTGAVTTVTSAAGGFTAAMVDNILRIASGTNAIPGYYRIVTYTDANTVVLDRTPASGAMSGGVGRVGGAFAHIHSLCSAGYSGVTAPAIATPLAPGHRVWVRGSGSNNPGTADYTQTGYATYPVGSVAVGMIRFSGYNGRPRIDVDGMVNWSQTLTAWEDFVIVSTSANFATNHRLETTVAKRIKLDQAGYDTHGLSAALSLGCEITNSGSTSAGTRTALQITPYGYAAGNLIKDWRGNGIYDAQLVSIVNNVVVGCRGAGGGIGIASASPLYAQSVLNNTVYDCAADGIVLQNANAAALTAVQNNVLVGNGGYGLRASDTEALNDLRAFGCDYNSYYDNTSGETVNIANGDNDITLSADPFNNAAGGDYTLNNTAGGGADLKNVAFPTSIP